MKYFLPIVALFLSTLAYAQKVNNYKYVIVPDKYDVMKMADQHQINALSKFLLNKYGFEAYLESDEKPFTMEEAGCSTLYADLINDSNFIQTRLFFLLKDCEGETVFKTSQGRSKKKEYEPAYHEALRDAFEDIKALQYMYNGKSNDAPKPFEKSKIKAIKVAKEKDQVMPKVAEVSKAIIEKESAEVKSKTAPSVIALSETDKPILYTSEDGFYRAVRFGRSITFYEEDKNIGSVTILDDSTFTVTTSQFDGTGYFKEGRLMIDRKIKGVVGVVQMIFSKQ